MSKRLFFSIGKCIVWKQSKTQRRYGTNDNAHLGQEQFENTKWVIKSRNEGQTLQWLKEKGQTKICIALIN